MITLSLLYIFFQYLNLKFNYNFKYHLKTLRGCLMIWCVITIILSNMLTTQSVIFLLFYYFCNISNIDTKILVINISY